MISIHVVSFKGSPPAQPMHAAFNELGGGIGRAVSNALVLPDPDRYVSRLHASIVYRDGAYLIRDTGSASPVQLNGKTLGNGREAMLADGDEIRIGPYILQVGAAQEAAAAAFPGIAPAAASHTAAFGTTATATASAPRDDPMAMFGSPSGDAFAPGLPPAPPQSAANRREGGGYETIPTGFDPFADEMPAPRSPAASSASPVLPPEFDLGLSPASGRNIDQIYGLQADKGADPFAAGHPLGDPSGGGPSGGNPLGGTGNDSRAMSLDPLVAIGAAAAPPPRPGTQRDDVPEIRAAFIPPSASFHDQQPGPARQAPDTPAGAPSGMLFSWNETGRTIPNNEIKTVVVQSPRQVTPPGQRMQEDASAPPSHARGYGPGVATPGVATPRVATPDAATPGAAPDALLLAFLAGAGVPELGVQGPLTPQMMHNLGELFRTATQGTLDLLLARTLIKREVRADVTMIVAQENNPLKFSPNVETALSHLLAPRGQGFMRPAAAMADAYNDLRAHQFGFMAGMRAALEGVLRRFDPAVLEQRLTEKSLVDSLLPMNRKAKLWSLFAELYADINQEAQDDFHALFGEEFLRAYESQLEKLENMERNRRGGGMPSDRPPARPAKDKP